MTAEKENTMRIKKRETKSSRKQSNIQKKQYKERKGKR